MLTTNRPRPRRCRHCREKFAPDRPGQLVHADCVLPYMEAQWAKRDAKAAKAKADAEKVDRARTKNRLEEIKPLAKLTREAQTAFNAWIRERDRDQPCICCGRTANDRDLITGSRWDCGHYRSTGSASHLRFHEDNAHRQLVVCNRHGAGRAVDYRIGLINRIGLARVEALEASNTPRKWSREELRAIRDDYRARVKTMRAA